jgi:transposase
MRLDFELGEAVRSLRSKIPARRGRPQAGRLRADGAKALGESGTRTRPRGSRAREHRQQIERWWASGASIAEIAERLEVSPTTVNWWLRVLRRDGAELPRRGGKGRPPRPASELRPVLRLHRQGVPPAEIARRLGLSRREIHNQAMALSRRGLWRPSSRRFSAEKLEGVAALAATRAPDREIADRLDLTLEEVSAHKQALRRRGHHLPRPRYRYTSEDIAVVVALWTAGATYAEIAERFGIGWETARDLVARMRANGYPLTPRGRRAKAGA